MKSKLLLLLLIMHCLAATAQDELTYLILWAKDGATVAYALSEEPKITYSPTDLIIKTYRFDVSYPLEQMARITYADNEQIPTNATNIINNEQVYQIEGESLIFYRIEGGTNISLFSINGQLIFSQTTNHDGEFVLPLSKIANGIYMIKVNSITYKIVKR